MRRWAGTGILALLGIAFSVSGWVSPAVTITLFVVAGIWALLALPFVASRLPKVVLERGDRFQGWAIRVLPPERQGKQRLRSDTMEFVKDVYDFLRSQPPDGAWAVGRHLEVTAAMQAASTEAARQEVWSRHVQELLSESERERRELTERFGGRIAYLTSEYRRRGMLDRQDAKLIEWQAQSVGWLAAAATTLEGLARRL